MMIVLNNWSGCYFHIPSTYLYIHCWCLSTPTKTSPTTLQSTPSLKLLQPSCPRNHPPSLCHQLLTSVSLCHSSLILPRLVLSCFDLAKACGACIWSCQGHKTILGSCRVSSILLCACWSSLDVSKVFAEANYLLYCYPIVLLERLCWRFLWLLLPVYLHAYIYLTTSCYVFTFNSLSSKQLFVITVKLNGVNYLF